MQTCRGVATTTLSSGRSNDFWVSTFKCRAVKGKKKKLAEKLVATFVSIYWHFVSCFYFFW